MDDPLDVYSTDVSTILRFRKERAAIYVTMLTRILQWKWQVHSDCSCELRNDALPVSYVINPKPVESQFSDLKKDLRWLYFPIAQLAMVKWPYLPGFAWFYMLWQNGTSFSFWCFWAILLNPRVKLWCAAPSLVLLLLIDTKYTRKNFCQVLNITLKWCSYCCPCCSWKLINYKCRHLIN